MKKQHKKTGIFEVFFARIIEMQARGLAKRMQHTGCKKLILGVSGGLDSTLALLVCYAGAVLLQQDSTCIVAVTMPGFGTTERTKSNALALAELLGCTVQTIPRKKALIQHFADIGHDPEKADTVYENAQARERTQIRMDKANQLNALLIGTGDLSESALGWATYNGDHMAMYNVNAGVLKTVLKYCITYFIHYPPSCMLSSCIIFCILILARVKCCFLLSRLFRSRRIKSIQRKKCFIA